MSRWTMPWSCANCSASQICGTMASASRGGDAAAVQKLAQVHAIHEFHEEVVKWDRPVVELGGLKIAAITQWLHR